MSMQSHPQAPSKPFLQRHDGRIAIGGVIGFEAMFGGPISGASMNPARWLAIFAGHVQHVWIYLIAPAVGSALAVLLAWGVFGRPVEQAQLVQSP